MQPCCLHPLGAPTHLPLSRPFCWSRTYLQRTLPEVTSWSWKSHDAYRRYVPLWGWKLAEQVSCLLSLCGMELSCNTSGPASFLVSLCRGGDCTWLSCDCDLFSCDLEVGSPEAVCVTVCELFVCGITCSGCVRVESHSVPRQGWKGVCLWLVSRRTNR